MTDTPRCDLVVHCISIKASDPSRILELAEELERELDALKALHYDEKLSCTRVIETLKSELATMTMRAEIGEAVCREKEWPPKRACAVLAEAEGKA